MTIDYRTLAFVALFDRRDLHVNAGDVFTERVRIEPLSKARLATSLTTPAVAAESFCVRSTNGVYYVNEPRRE